MSLCDSCYAPGYCCRGFTLNVSWAGSHVPRLEVLAMLASVNSEHEPGIGLPFIPLETDQGSWRFECVNLGSDGRCTDYENRPQLCRAFEAGSDRLCAHYRGAEAGCE